MVKHRRCVGRVFDLSVYSRVTTYMYTLLNNKNDSAVSELNKYNMKNRKISNKMF